MSFLFLITVVSFLVKQPSTSIVVLVMAHVYEDQVMAQVYEYQVQKSEIACIENDTSLTLTGVFSIETH